MRSHTQRPARQQRIFLALASVVLIGVAGCGDTSTGNGLGQSCRNSGDCKDGLRCNLTLGECEIDPAVAGDMAQGDGQSGADASDGQSGPDGQSSDTGAPGDTNTPFDFETCAGVEVEFTPTIPTIILLVDRSSSMETQFGDTDRWNAVQDVLFNDDYGVVTRYEEAVRFGIVTYNSEGGFAGGECPILHPVEPMLSNASEMEMLLASELPSGDTPTGESVEGVVPLFSTVVGRTPKILLLATDGEPDTCEVPNPQEGQEESIAAVQGALQSGIQTFVLSVGSEVGEPHLQDLANAGVGLEVGGSENAPFWKADAPDALSDAVNEIITGARPCVFGVQGATIDPAKADQGVFLLNDTPLEYGGADGWELHTTNPPCFNTGQCIELSGTACTTVQTDPDPVLQAGFPCEAASGN